MKTKRLLFVVVSGIFLLNLFRANAQNYIINTSAGNGVNGFSGDGGPATSAELNTPFGVALDSAGNLYIADQGNCRIRKVNTNGIISTIAGTGTPGFAGDGGPATAAQLKYPQGVLVDHSGNILIGDAVNNRVRKIDKNGIITTFAGNGGTGSSGDGGLATAAEIYQPFQLSIDSAGNIYIGDWAGNRIRKVDANGIITTVAGNGSQGFGGDGGLATAAKIYYPDNCYFDSLGNMYIADTYNQRIRKVNKNGIISTIAGTGNQAYSGDGGVATAAALSDPSAVITDNSGNIIFSDWDNSRIRQIDHNGVINTIAGNGTGGYSGDGGLATSAEINCVNGIAIKKSTGDIYFADRCNDRIRILTISLSGILINTESKEVSIYPNPTTGQFKIQVGNEQLAMGECKIEIMNAFGEKIVGKTFPASAISYQSAYVDISNRPNGIYFFKLIANDKNYYEKIVANK